LGRAPEPWELRDLTRLFELVSWDQGESGVDGVDVGEPTVDPEVRAAAELFAAQPEIYENAAELLLNRFLDWDEESPRPRTPGTIMPRARQALARSIEETGDIPLAERTILTSWLYKQRTAYDTASDRPVYAVGPVKRASTEIWLDSVMRDVQEERGGCDPRYPRDYYYRSIEYQRDLLHLGPGVAEERFQRAKTLLDSRVPLQLVNGWLQPDDTYRELAEKVGYCGARMQPAAVAFALSHEEVVGDACERFRGRELELGRTVFDQIRRMHRDWLARTPSDAEVQQLEDEARVFDDPVHEACIALLGSAEMIFY
jgi:hypothetical protein